MQGRPAMRQLMFDWASDGLDDALRTEASDQPSMDFDLPRKNMTAACMFFTAAGYSPVSWTLAEDTETLQLFWTNHPSCLEIRSSNCFHQQVIQQSNICTYIYIYYTHIMYYIHIFNEHTTVIHSRVPILQHETARHMTSSSKPLACGETMLMRQEAVMPAWLKLKVQSCGVQQGPGLSSSQQVKNITSSHVACASFMTMHCKLLVQTSLWSKKEKAGTWSTCC